MGGIAPTVVAVPAPLWRSQHAGVPGAVVLYASRHDGGAAAARRQGVPGAAILRASRRHRGRVRRRITGALLGPRCAPGRRLGVAIPLLTCFARAAGSPSCLIRPLRSSSFS